MLREWIKGRRTAATRAREAAQLAERTFLGAYPSRQLISGMTSAFHDDGTVVVVQLCHQWGGIPPHRSWWLVSADGSCRELSFDETSEFRPVPAWR